MSKSKVKFIERKAKIRVGRITYEKGGAVHPVYEGYTPIVVLTKSSKYGDLGPYELKDENGRIMENYCDRRGNSVRYIRGFRRLLRHTRDTIPP